jgi:hypothetical protein
MALCVIMLMSSLTYVSISSEGNIEGATMFSNGGGNEQRR